MNHPYMAHWHKASYDRFIYNRLPELLASRLPVAGYHAEAVDTYHCRITVTLSAGDTQAQRSYTLPQPDAEGVFRFEDGAVRMVIPSVPHARLETAPVSCVGEFLYDAVNRRLGEAPENLAWDNHLMEAWLPLEKWVDQFFKTHIHVIDLNQQNTLSRIESLRMLRIETPDGEFDVEQFGRVCPVMTPEGPNTVHIRFIATGAEIRDGRVVILRDDPAAGHSLSALLIPFFEHTDRNRKMMGANMMRQWHIPPDPEPALVQTGYEPDMAGFWCGRNILTAFILWNGYACQDGIVLSASAARRFGYPYPVEAGDKLSNRHGIKGVVSRILPDEKMPRMENGTPVEMICSSLGLLTRFMMGPLKEAVMGRIAMGEGEPATIAPLNAPDEKTLRDLMARHGVAEDGMEQLTLDDRPMACRSTVGWVYWGKTYHDADDKIRAVSDLSPEDKKKPLTDIQWKALLPRSLRNNADTLAGTPTRGQRHGEMEYWAIRDIGAYDFLLEQFNTRADLSEYDHPLPIQRENLADRLIREEAAQAAPPTPQFLDLQQRLGHAGIIMTFTGEQVTFRSGRPSGRRMELAQPASHPWLRTGVLQEIGLWDGLPEAREVEKANSHLATLMADKAPESLISGAAKQLQNRLDAYLKALLPSRSPMRLDNNLLFSGRAVIAPGPDLRYDQIGLPEEMAWVLFGPAVARECGTVEAGKKRTPEAEKTLDALMDQSYVVVNRAPTTTATCVLAFHPVRIKENVLRVHPFFCPLMNADHDGDQTAVFLPITPEGRKDAEERLTIAGQARRDPAILRGLLDGESLWGLSWLSLTESGRREIEALAGTPVDMSVGHLNDQAITKAVDSLIRQRGVVTALDALDRLMKRGFEAARLSGGSMGPFFGSNLDRSGRPETDDPKDWERYAEELQEAVISRTDYEHADIGTALLAIKSGARGRAEHLRRWIGAAGNFVGPDGALIPVRTSLSEGLSFDALRAEAVGSHRGLVRFFDETAAFGKEFREARMTRGFNALARAMRSPEPGVVFARAAAVGDTDPLADLDSRLFVGLKP